MRWSDLLRMSISSLKRRKLRTFLTVLGVVIGTASIVVMISLGLGLQESMYAEVEKNGGTTGITVTGKESSGMYPGGSSDEEGKKYITDDVIKELRTLGNVKSVEPVYNLSAIALKGRYEGSVELCGMTPEGIQSLNLALEAGGRLPDPGSAQLELLYGNAVLSNFYDKGTGKTYWDTGEAPDIDLKNDSLFLILDQDSYYQSQNTNTGGSSGGSEGGAEAGSQGQQPPTAPKKYVVKGSGVIAGGMDNYSMDSFKVYCDLDKLREYLKKEFSGRVIPGQPSTKSGKPYSKFVYSSAKVQADDMENVEELAGTIRSLGYNVETNAEYIDSMKKQFAMVQAVLGGIGAVSLLVAAIGIANTMMMSIYERTKEIGVMKVIGCGLKNIRQLFLLEAAFIGLAGGIIGNILSLTMSVVINMFVSGGSLGVTGNISFIPVWLLLVSTGFAVLVGTAAGYFPARRAMSLSPLEAIRSQ
ncbi:MAG TPA: ABC transporter permease [Candidatus Mediterraneibacter stercorigallinarum]|uniref:ABC transporter permease n=1 Tax=Candidatus Mediterraneibacter stercorigallinarum TaxID=2838686 RepID=A0A9D2IKS0_9FIRM|nr:ABC transporter permease [Candidatus Mediterraneibacter stercorigallinarum]